MLYHIYHLSTQIFLVIPFFFHVRKTRKCWEKNKKSVNFCFHRENMKHNQKEKQEPVRGVYAWNVKFMRVEVCQKCKFWLLSRRCPVLLASIPPPVLCDPTVQILVWLASLSETLVYISSQKRKYFEFQKKKTSLTCCLCVQMCHSGICPHLSGQGKIRAAFTLRCPLIGGQQPSSTVMLDLWMKPPPPLPHCKKKKKKLHIWLQKNILLLLFNTY